VEIRFADGGSEKTRVKGHPEVLLAHLQNGKDDRLFGGFTVKSKLVKTYIIQDRAEPGIKC
jgi:hypothetical protein